MSESGSGSGRDEDDEDDDEEERSDDYSDSDDEGEEGYKQGGYHRVNVGEVFADRYTILKKLGWGHFSTVWMAHDTEKNARVALKVQKSASHYTEAALDEIELLRCVSTEYAQLSVHGRRATASAAPSAADGSEPAPANVVQLRDYFEHAGPHGKHVCMVFEMLGPNLLSLIKQYKYHGIPVQIVRSITLQVCRGMDYLHRRCKIIHTDLKPENILLGAAQLELSLGVDPKKDKDKHERESHADADADADLDADPDAGDPGAREHRIASSDHLGAVVARAADMDNRTAASSGSATEATAGVTGVTGVTGASLDAMAATASLEKSGRSLADDRFDGLFDANFSHAASAVAAAHAASGRYADDVGHLVDGGGRAAAIPPAAAPALACTLRRCASAPGVQRVQRVRGVQGVGIAGAGDEANADTTQRSAPLSPDCPDWARPPDERVVELSLVTTARKIFGALGQPHTLPMSGAPAELGQWFFILELAEPSMAEQGKRGDEGEAMSDTGGGGGGVTGAADVRPSFMLRGDGDDTEATLTTLGAALGFPARPRPLGGAPRGGGPAATAPSSDPETQAETQADGDAAGDAVLKWSIVLDALHSGLVLGCLEALIPDFAFLLAPSSSSSSSSSLAADATAARQRAHAPEPGSGMVMGHSQRGLGAAGAWAIQGVDIDTFTYDGRSEDASASASSQTGKPTLQPLAGRLRALLEHNGRGRSRASAKASASASSSSSAGPLAPHSAQTPSSPPPPPVGASATQQQGSKGSTKGSTKDRAVRDDEKDGESEDGEDGEDEQRRENELAQVCVYTEANTEANPEANAEANTPVGLSLVSCPSRIVIVSSSLPRRKRCTGDGRRGRPTCGHLSGTPVYTCLGHLSGHNPFNEGTKGGRRDLTRPLRRARVPMCACARVPSRVLVLLYIGARDGC